MSPMFTAVRRWQVATVFLTSAMTIACGSTPAPSKAEKQAPDKPEAKPQVTPPEKTTDQALATVDDSLPLALPKLLGKPPTEVEAMLGAHRGKATQSSSCTRFLPERTMFRCDRVWQDYDDKTDTFRGIHVLWEDGLSAEVAYDFKASSEPFSREAALAQIGLKLPQEPKTAQPAEGVTLWQWFNSSARLLIHNQQYRVDLSISGDQWETARLSVILNHPLTPEQQKLVIQKKPEMPDIKAPPPPT